MPDPVTDIANAFDLATVALKAATDMIALATQQSQLLTSAQNSQVASLMAQTTAMDSATGSVISALYTTSGALATATAQSQALAAAQAAIITQLSGANAGAGIYGPATFGLQLFTRAVNDAAVAAWNFTQAANNPQNPPGPPRPPSGGGPKGPGDAFLVAAQKAAAQFDVVNNAILGAVHNASPVAWDTLGKSFAILGAQIGKSFIPYVIEAAGWLQKGADYVATMDTAQKSSIARWIEYGVVVLAAGKGISIVLSLLTPLATGLRLVGASLAFLIANPAVAAVALFAAGLGYVAYQADQAVDALSRLVHAQDNLADSISKTDLMASKEFQNAAAQKNPDERKKELQQQMQAVITETAKKLEELKRIESGGILQDIPLLNKLPSGEIGQGIGISLHAKEIKTLSDEILGLQKRLELLKATYNQLVLGKPFVPGPAGAAADAELEKKKAAASGKTPSGGKGPSLDVSHEMQPQYFSDFAQARKAIELASVGKSDLDRQLLQAQRDGNQIAKQAADDIKQLNAKTPPLPGPQPKPTTIGP
jgi:hypothetical protein